MTEEDMEKRGEHGQKKFSVRRQNSADENMDEGVFTVEMVHRGSMDSMGENRGVVENWVDTNVPSAGNSVDGVDRDSGVDELNRVGDLSNISSVQ